MGSVVVPWFSKDEWIETYQAAFSNDVCQWRDAKDTMLVWQARVEKLPTGIDVTLPLLQAKIMDADPTVESAVKSIFLASALQRFVTSIVKLPQTKYYRAQSMHNLALEIGLPMHLVDLRNEIVHGHGGWAGGDTILKALDVAYKWIKGYYWDAEYEKTHLNISSVSGIPSEEWEDFLSLLKKYTKLTISFAKKKVSMYTKVKNALIQQLESLCCLDFDECTRAIVSHVLVPEPSSDLGRHLANAVDECECGRSIDSRVLERVEPILRFFCYIEEGIESLLICLMNRGQECSKLSSEWIRIIAGGLLQSSCFSSQECKCTTYSLVLEEPSEGLKWKNIVVDLLTVQMDWSTDIAFRIMDNPKTRITDSQKEKIKELNFLNECTKDCSIKKTKGIKQMEDIYTVDDIVSVAKNLPLAERRRLERLRISVTGLDNDAVKIDTPLGLLSHQTDNSLFYKELILQYPDPETFPPSSKRLKLH